MDDLTIVPVLITATEQAAKMQLNVYPNPADAFIQIDTKTADLKLCNTLGEEVPVIVAHRDGGQHIEVKHLPEGVYILRINDREHITLQKVVVAHSRP